jgi:hypothetical protein
MRRSSNAARRPPGSRTPCSGAVSLRRGLASQAVAAGVPQRDVQRYGRWRSRASMDPYIDAARTFDAANPTHWLA